MKCSKCEGFMNCKDTRGDDSVRFRKYVCSNCGHVVKTKEVECSSVEYSDGMSKVLARKKYEMEWIK